VRDVEPVQKIELHTALKRRLSDVFVESYPILHVEHNMFLQLFSVVMFSMTLDKKLESHGKLRSALEKVLGDNPLLEFLSDQIGIDLLENDDYQSEPRFKLLKDAQGFEDASEKAKLYIDALASLPWSYVVSIELPEALSIEIKTIVAGNMLIGNLCLATDLHSANSSLPLCNLPTNRNRRLFKPNFFALLSTNEENERRQWRDGRALLQIRLDGYVDIYGTSRTSKQFLGTLKSFLGLGLALRILRYKRKYVAYPERVPVFVHRTDLGSPFLLHKYDLSQRISEAVQGISAYYAGLPDKDQEGAKNWSRAQLVRASKLFSATDKYQGFLTACSWYFDSITNEDNLLGFVQAMVVLEILLGDDEPSGELSLGTLLRNRCAYLIAKTGEEREKIKRELKAIYDVRSKIVHRGKSDLTSSELSMLGELRSLCARVILAEFKLLTDDGA
jgi:Apea-like HEPN